MTGHNLHEILTLSIPHGNYSSLLWYWHQIFGHHQGCNYGSGTIHYPVLSLLRSKQLILQHQHTFPAISKPTILYSSIYMQRAQLDITSKCSLQIQKASDTNLPTQIAPDVWILTTPLAAPANSTTLICPEEAMATIIIQKPVHILKLPMACSATSSNFYLPPRYKIPWLWMSIDH